MRTIIIGGSGHIGSYLVPMLLEAGHHVINVSRQTSRPYRAAAMWREVESIVLDRRSEDQAGTFGRTIAKLQADIVIDNICFTPESCRLIVEALAGSVRHFLMTGTVWVHGPAESIPTKEDAVRKPIGEYGINKNAIEQYLIDFSCRTGFPATVLHPGHIVGPGWVCINPQGGANLEVFQTIAGGRELTLPNFGLETLHHVHAEDVAQGFIKAIQRPSASIGESFHVVSEAALTLRGYAEAAYGWFGHQPRLRFMPAGELAKLLTETDATDMMEHISRSPCASIEKARRLLDYQPRHTSLQACREAVAWMIQHGKIRGQMVD